MGFAGELLGEPFGDLELFSVIEDAVEAVLGDIFIATHGRFRLKAAMMRQRFTRRKEDSPRAPALKGV